METRGGGGADVRVLECVSPGISFSLLPPAPPCPPNLLSLNGTVPLTCLGHVPILLLSMFAPANHASAREFDQREWDVVNRPLGPRGLRDPGVGGRESSGLAGSVRGHERLHPPATFYGRCPLTSSRGSGVRAGVGGSRWKTAVYTSLQRSFLTRYLYLFPDQ